jgi:hypothetical protein
METHGGAMSDNKRWNLDPVLGLHIPPTDDLVQSESMFTRGPTIKPTGTDGPKTIANQFTGGNLHLGRPAALNPNSRGTDGFPTFLLQKK